MEKKEYKVGYCKPPNRFSSTNQPKIRGRKKGRSPTDWLKALSHTEINFQNPLTGKPDRAEVNLVVAIQLILKATQDSDLPSIREYFDRLDGKVIQKLEGSGLVGESKIIIVTNGKHNNQTETIPREIPAVQ